MTVRCFQLTLTETPEESTEIMGCLGNMLIKWLKSAPTDLQHAVYVLVCPLCTHCCHRQAATPRAPEEKAPLQAE